MARSPLCFSDIFFGATCQQENPIRMDGVFFLVMAACFAVAFLTKTNSGGIILRCLLLADQFHLTGNFPNSSIAFASTCILGNGYLRLSGAAIIYRNSESTSTKFADFVFFPNLNADCLKGENFQRLGYCATAFDGLTVVGVGE